MADTKKPDQEKAREWLKANPGERTIYEVLAEFAAEQNKETLAAYDRLAVEYRTREKQLLDELAETRVRMLKRAEIAEKRVAELEGEK